MKEIKVGNSYLHNDKHVTCTAKHASGKWFTYHFSDGWSFSGDPVGMLANGTLKEVPAVLPPVKPRFPFQKPNNGGDQIDTRSNT